MYEAVFLEHGGVSIVEAGEAPPTLRGDWSDSQNENKRPNIVFNHTKCEIICTVWTIALYCVDQWTT